MTFSNSYRYSALSLCLAFSGVLSARPVLAAQQLKLNAVDSNTFHLLAYPSGLPSPAPSPFVVKTADWTGAKLQNHSTASSVGVPVGDFVLDSQGRWSFKNKKGELALSGTVSASTGQTTFTLKHGPNERFYGAGNEKRDFSGPLTHPSGTVIVDNGVTRVGLLPVSRDN